MRIITIDENKRVVEIKEVKENYVLGVYDIVSDMGKIGQIMQNDGTFIDAPIEPVEIKPTLEEQISKLQQDNITLMDAMASMYEEILNLKEPMNV